GELDCYHDRVRQTVLGSRSGEALRDRHARLARALEGAPARDLERLAQHFGAAGDRRRAASYAALAADQAAAALAFDRAARLYGEALEAADVAERRSLLVRLGDALAGAGRGVEAAGAYDDARVGAPPDEDALLHRKV